MALGKKRAVSTDTLGTEIKPTPTDRTKLGRLDFDRIVRIGEHVIRHRGTPLARSLLVPVRARHALTAIGTQLSSCLRCRASVTKEGGRSPLSDQSSPNSAKLTAAPPATMVIEHTDVDQLQGVSQPAGQAHAQLDDVGVDGPLAVNRVTGYRLRHSAPLQGQRILLDAPECTRTCQDFAARDSREIKCFCAWSTNKIRSLSSPIYGE